MQPFTKILMLSSIIFICSCNNTATQNEDSTTHAATEKATSAKKMDAAPQDLTKYGIATNPENILGGLKVGDKAPDFTTVDQDGKTQNLSSALKNGPVLLVFLRAEWCSFCVRHLQEFEASIEEIHKSGATQVLAVSPQLPSYMKDFHKEHNFSFPILFDEDHSIMKNYKGFFHVTKKYNDYIKKAKGEHIEVFNGDLEPVMPIPATYLIGQDQIIDYVHYDENYKKRSDVKAVIAELL